MQGTLPGAAPACVPGELLPGAAAGWEAIRIGQHGTRSSPTMHVPHQQHNTRMCGVTRVWLSYWASGQTVRVVGDTLAACAVREAVGTNRGSVGTILTSSQSGCLPIASTAAQVWRPGRSWSRAEHHKFEIVPSESSGLATSKIFGRVIGRSPSDFEYCYPQIERSVTLRVNRQSCIQ